MDTRRSSNVYIPYLSPENDIPYSLVRIFSSLACALIVLLLSPWVLVPELLVFAIACSAATPLCGLCLTTPVQPFDILLFCRCLDRPRASWTWLAPGSLDFLPVPSPVISGLRILPTPVVTLEQLI